MAIGLNYASARWYNPQTQQWMQIDPIGFAAGDENLRRYVGNNPTNATDPTGLFAARKEVSAKLDKINYWKVTAEEKATDLSQGKNVDATALINKKVVHRVF